MLQPPPRHRVVDDMRIPVQLLVEVGGHRARRKSHDHLQCFRKNPKTSTSHPLGWPVIDKLEDRFSSWVEMSRAKKNAQPEADLEFRLFCARLSEFVNRISAATQCPAMRDVNGGLPRCLKMSEPRRRLPREGRCCRSNPNGAALR